MIKFKNFKSSRGFSLAELLVYVAIFSIVAVVMTGLLTSITRVGEREAASSEVTSQLNLVMHNIQRLVRDSSYVDIPSGVSTSTLTLRMRDPAKDPTVISLVGSSLQIQEGTAAPSTLTNERVVINSLSFRKISQYPGHDTVGIDLTMTNNAPNANYQVTRTLSSAVVRVSAATFDSPLIPGASNNYDVGTTGSQWRNGYFASDIYVLYPGSGLILKSPNGSLCERLSITNSGAVTTTPVTCY